ncbi:MAG TPA: hemerythrin domain-containing protein [Bacteroidales bacterium]
MKLAEVIHHDHGLVAVINRFGIYLGFGDRKIETICEENNINIDFFLTILNTFHDPHYFPKKHLQSFPASLIIDYLAKTHRYYLDEKIPEIEKLIAELTQKNQQNKEAFVLLQNFFSEYKQELSNHIYREEKRVYPYVIELEKAIESGIVTVKLQAEMDEYSITDYEAEHEDVEEKLFDLKNIIIKYIPSSAGEKLVNTILHEVFALENDLKDHARIEDMILVPKVEAMEYTIKNIR